MVAEIEAIQEKKKDTEEKYQAMLSQIKKVIIDIAETKKTVSESVTKMNVYNKDIAQTIRTLKETRSFIINAKESLTELVQVMYLLQNDYYGAGDGQIDDVKLLLKSDNISDTLSTDEIMDSLITQFDTLIADLAEHQEKYTAQYHTLSDLRAGYKKTVLAYEEKIQTLEEQKIYLMDFLKLYRSNKAVLNAEMNTLFQTRAQLKAKIATIIVAVRDHKFSEAFVASENYKQFLEMSDKREKRKNYFLWPVLPVENISTYFNPEEIGKEEGFAGIKIQATQLDELYAPADGIVYKAADQDGIAVNRLMLVHHDGYVTVFTNINKLLVKE